MAKQVMQFRYYGEDNEANYPKAKASSISAATLKSGKIFANYLPITHLKIQSVEGVKFYINGGVNSIMLGSSGVYELDLEGISSIHKLTFDSNNNYSAPLIIDIIYEKE